MFSRRIFLKTGIGASVMSGISAAQAFTPQPKKWNEEFDVVIIGAGDGGLAAGCVAVQKGHELLRTHVRGFMGACSHF